MLWEPNTVWSRGLNECSQFTPPAPQIGVGKQHTTNRKPRIRFRVTSPLLVVNEGVCVGEHEEAKKENYLLMIRSLWLAGLRQTYSRSSLAG